MNCVVEGPNVKSLAKAIQALARIGEDLYIEALPHGLELRTVNSSRSAYVCFTFKPDFFAQYKEATETKCKVSLKSCVMAFRSLPAMEKTVEKCLLDTSSSDCSLLVQFSCKHDLTKIYLLPFIENETVQAAFKKQTYQCKLIAQTRLLSDGIQNFSSGVEEVTLTVTTDQVTLKNYVDNDFEQSKVVHTELTLESDEFDDFEVQQNVEVTFCLKELKTILGFADGFNATICISCQCGGKPILFNINNIVGVESEFVLATLAERGAQLSSQAQGSYISVSSEARPNASSISRKNEKRGRGRARGSRISGVQVLTSQKTIENGNSSQHEQDHVLANQTVSVVSESGEVINLDIDDNMEEEQDSIPSTPPAKKQFRLDFLGLSSSSQYTSMLPESDVVLAAASDED